MDINIKKICSIKKSIESKERVKLDKLETITIDIFKQQPLGEERTKYGESNYESEK